MFDRGFLNWRLDDLEINLCLSVKVPNETWTCHYTGAKIRPSSNLVGGAVLAGPIQASSLFCPTFELSRLH